MATLRLNPTAPGPPVLVDRDSAVVGRDPTCEVVLVDGSVSRRHARLEHRGNQWFVVDQVSANGTFVDSQRVSEAELRDGQELRFGAVGFAVHIESERTLDTAATLSPDEGATVIQPALPPIAPAAPPPPPPPPPRAPAVAPPAAAAAAAAAPPPPPPPPPRVNPPPAVGSSAPRPAAAAVPGPPRTGRGPFFWVGAGCCSCVSLVLLGIALIGGVVYWGTEAPAAAVRAQLKEMKSGDFDAAYARLSDSYKARHSRDEFILQIAAHPGLRDNADATFSSRSWQNNTAHLSGTVVSTTGVVEEVAYDLVKEQGDWKISSIRFAGDVTLPEAPPHEEG